MKPIVQDDITIRKYLLGELSPAEQSEVEERLFLDGEYFQQLLMAEDDLVDDYVYGELSPDERERFDNHFLSTPERYESLRIAQALKKYGSTDAAPIQSSAASDVRPTTPTKIAFFSCSSSCAPAVTGGGDLADRSGRFMVDHESGPVAKRSQTA
jgi:anti-sigma factor RsiW